MSRMIHADRLRRKHRHEYQAGSISVATAEALTVDSLVRPMVIGYLSILDQYIIEPGIFSIRLLAAQALLAARVTHNWWTPLL